IASRSLVAAGPCHLSRIIVTPRVRGLRERAASSGKMDVQALVMNVFLSSFVVCGLGDRYQLAKGRLHHAQVGAPGRHRNVALELGRKLEEAAVDESRRPAGPPHPTGGEVGAAGVGTRINKG